jgi:6-phosphogluconate dehydrogenase (decarboxylating)
MSSLKTQEEYDTQSANAAAEYAGQCLFHIHRGILDCGDKVILYGNDGYKEDPRSQKEVELVSAALKDLGHDKPIFGQSQCGYTWSLMILDYNREIKTVKHFEKILEVAWNEVRQPTLTG